MRTCGRLVVIASGYFTQNMMHILKDAIIDLAKEMPEDPIGHMADFLFKNAYRVPESARGDI